MLRLALDLAALAVVARVTFNFGFKRGREDRSLEDFNTQHDDYFMDGFAEGFAKGFDEADSKADAEWPS